MERATDAPDVRGRRPRVRAVIASTPSALLPSAN
jgi:hypothetical protein